MMRRVVLQAAVVALVALPLTGCSYNTFVSQEEAIKAQWAQVENQLQRRNDLIPNLVETVKGYASHEKETLEKVIAARNMAVAARGPQELAQAENLLSGALKSLFAVAEAYPDLKANQNFLDLQEERDAAVGHYRAALSADQAPEVKAAAERGLKQPYEPPGHSQR